jgi:hypothetical protein
MPLFDAPRGVLARRAPRDFFAAAFFVVFDFLGPADFLEAMVFCFVLPFVCLVNRIPPAVCLSGLRGSLISFVRKNKSYWCFAGTATYTAVNRTQPHT